MHSEVINGHLVDGWLLERVRGGGGLVQVTTRPYMCTEGNNVN